MAIIDIRGTDESVVDTIVFADADDGWTTAVSLVRASEHVVGVQSDDDNDMSYKILNKEHAINLIKALNKSIELGWLH